MRITVRRSESIGLHLPLIYVGAHPVCTTTNRPCTRCGSPSVSQSLHEVYGPHDQRLQNAPGELRRAREQIKTFVVVTFGMCGVVAFIAWLVALCMGGQLGVAIVLGAVVFLLCCATSPWIQLEYARSKARNFENRFLNRLSSLLINSAKRSIQKTMRYCSRFFFATRFPQACLSR